MQTSRFKRKWISLAPLGIVSLYVMSGIVWILFSDRVILQLVESPMELTRIQTFKGWIFVLFTALLLALLLRAYANRMKKMLYDNLRVRERLQLAVQSANLGLFDIDLVRQSVYFSPQWKRQIGYREGELGDEFVEWQRRIHPDDLRRTLEDYEKLIAAPGKDFRCEYRLRHKDGTYRWFMGTAFARVDPAGKTSRVIGLQHDIHDLKTAEREIAENEVRFRTMVEAMPVGIFLLDENGFLNYCNGTTEELTGYAQSELAGLQWVRAIEPEQRKKTVETWRQTIAEREPSFLETRFRQPDGAVRWCQVSTVPTIVEGHVTGHVGIINDMTVFYQAQSSLQESEKKYRELAEFLPAGIFHADTEGRITYVNSRLCEILGIPEDGPPDPAWREALHTDERKNVLAEWERSVSKAAFYSRRCCLSTLDGRSITVLIEARPQFSGNGQWQGHVGFVVDLSELAEAREEVFRLNRELEQRVEERTRDLELKNRQLEQINRLFVGRELRMAELKEKLARHGPEPEEAPRKLERS